MSDRTKEQCPFDGKHFSSMARSACPACNPNEVGFVTPQGEPALTPPQELPGTREPVVTAPKGNAGESPASTSSKTKLKPGEPNHCRFCGSPYTEIDRMAEEIERLSSRVALLEHGLRDASGQFSWLAEHHLNGSFAPQAARELSHKFWDLQSGKRSSVETSRDEARDAARYRFIRQKMTEKGEVTYYSMPHSLMFLRGVCGETAFDREVDARINGAAFESMPPLEPSAPLVAKSKQCTSGGPMPRCCLHILHVDYCPECQRHLKQLRAVDGGMTHESKWAAHWHRLVESIATILEVNSALGYAELAHEIPQAIQRLRDMRQDETSDEYEDCNRRLREIHKISTQSRVLPEDVERIAILSQWATDSAEKPFVVTDRMQGVDCPHCEDGTPHLHAPPGSPEEPPARTNTSMGPTTVSLESPHDKDLPEAADIASGSAELCSDCPPIGYPTDKTRCAPCPRRAVKATGEQS